MTRQGATRDQKSEHQGVVVGPAQQHQEDQGIEHGQCERDRLIATGGSGQREDPPCDQGHNIVPDQVEDTARETLPCGPVRGAGVTPERIHQAEDPSGSEDARAVDVRIETPGDHFALRHIAVDVPAEQWRHDKDRQRPREGDGDHRSDRSTRVSTQCAHEPRSDHHHHARVHEHDAQERAAPRRRRGTGADTEEPCPRRLQHER